MQPKSIDLGRGNYTPTLTPYLQIAPGKITNFTKKAQGEPCNFYKTS